MTKLEFIEFLKDVPDEAYIMVGTEDGMLPICVSDTHLNKDPDDGTIALVICPCYCALDAEIDEEIANNPLEQIILDCPEPEHN